MYYIQMQKWYWNWLPLYDDDDVDCPSINIYIVIYILHYKMEWNSLILILHKGILILIARVGHLAPLLLYCLGCVESLIYAFWLSGYCTVRDDHPIQPIPT